MLVNMILSTAMCLKIKSERSKPKIKNCSKGAIHFMLRIGFTHAQQVITLYKECTRKMYAIKECLALVDCWKYYKLHGTFTTKEFGNA